MEATVFRLIGARIRGCGKNVTRARYAFHSEERCPLSHGHAGVWLLRADEHTPLGGTSTLLETGRREYSGSFMPFCGLANGYSGYIPTTSGFGIKSGGLYGG
jgi:hypothetical protein